MVIKEFSALKPEQFERYRTAVIQRKLERPESIGDEAELLFYRAFELDGNFDHTSEDIRAVEELTQVEVQEILQDKLLGRGASRLAIQLIGRDHPEGKISGEQIQIPSQSQKAKAG